LTVDKHSLEKRLLIEKTAWRTGIGRTNSSENRKLVEQTARGTENRENKQLRKEKVCM
jgi:hypothetical protein